jgi:hypothetical protein
MVIFCISRVVYERIGIVVIYLFIVCYVLGLDGRSCFFWNYMEFCIIIMWVILYILFFGVNL